MEVQVEESNIDMRSLDFNTGEVLNYHTAAL